MAIKALKKMLCYTVADANARRTGDTLGKVKLVTQVGWLAHMLLERQRSW